MHGRKTKHTAAAAAAAAQPKEVGYVEALTVGSSEVSPTSESEQERVPFTGRVTSTPETEDGDGGGVLAGPGGV